MSALEKLNAAIEALAGMVAWLGHDDHGAYCDRADDAERILRGLAPDLLKRERAKIKAMEKADK